MKKGIVLITLIAIVGSLTFFAMRPAAVDTCQVTPQDVNRRLVVMGRVTPRAEVQIGSTIPGRVKTVQAEEGSSVKAGDLLVTLEDDELLSSVKIAEAALAQSKARLEQLSGTEARIAEETLSDKLHKLEDAKANLARSQQLFDKQALSKAELERAETELKAAQSQYDIAAERERATGKGGSDFNLARAAFQQAAANLMLAQHRQQSTLITAPFSGVILSRSVEPGAVLQSGQALLTLARTDSARLLADIEEKNLASVFLKQQALVSPEAYPERKFKAEVSFISKAVDPTRGTITVRLDALETPEYLKSDMTVSIDLDVARIEGAMLIPADALFEEQGKAFIWVFTEGKSTKRPVITGFSEAGRVQVVEGLAPGDIVILPGTQDKKPLKEGIKVRATAGKGC